MADDERRPVYSTTNSLTARAGRYDWSMSSPMS
jgi:hypothetical protein